jgi:hypothetical protein
VLRTVLEERALGDDVSDSKLEKAMAKDFVRQNGIMPYGGASSGSPGGR